MTPTLFVIVKESTQAFHGYGTMMSQPLRCSLDADVLRASLFRSTADAKAEIRQLEQTFDEFGLEIWPIEKV